MDVLRETDMVCAGCGSVLPASTAGPRLSYCESCALSYRGAAARMELDLAGLAAALGQNLGTVSLRHDPAEKEFDFFISFSVADAEMAGDIHQLLESRGYRTTFVPCDEGDEGAYLHGLHEGLKQARRMILLLSRDYLRSGFGYGEWQEFLSKDGDGRQRVMVLFQAAECDVPDGVTAVDVAGKAGRELEKTVLRTATGQGEASAGTGTYSRRRAAEKDSGGEEEERQEAAAGWMPVAALAVFVPMLLLVPAVPVVVKADLQLPLSWMLFDGNVRERGVVEGNARPLTAWMGLGGTSPNLRWNKQWLDVTETALLRTTAGARDGIAQYTVGFLSGGVNLLSRASGSGDTAYETRLEFVRPGELKIFVGRREARGYTALKHTRPGSIYVGTQTLHDVAVSMVGDLHTVWLNGRSVTTFRDSKLMAGAVGLRVAPQDKVRLYRWSVNLEGDNEASRRTVEPRYWARVDAMDPMAR